MPLHTVGLVGTNGRVGQPTLKHLVHHAEKGAIKVVAFHRAGKAPSGLTKSENVETRELDMEADVGPLQAATKGINVLIAAVGRDAVPHVSRLVEAFAKNPGCEVFIPSIYGAYWDKDDWAHPVIGGFLNMIYSQSNIAIEKGLGVAIVTNGLFDEYFFRFGFLGWSLAKNEATWNQQIAHHPLPITFMEHLGKVIADVAAQSPASIKGTVHSAVTYQPTGQQLIDLYTKLNGGKAPTQLPWGDKEIEEAWKDPTGFGTVKAAYLGHWMRGDWQYAQGDKFSDKFVGAPPLEDLARQFM